MNKYLKYKTSKKPNAISALQHHLFDKLGQVENNSYASRDCSDPLF
jgi:stalled ribosome alternative rescue factor ArfA